MGMHDAVKADVVILAVPFRAHAAVGREIADWSGKVVVDAMNTYGVSPEELTGQASTHLVAAAFPGAKVVKTLNQLPAKLLAMNPVDSGERPDRPGRTAGTSEPRQTRMTPLTRLQSRRQ